MARDTILENVRQAIRGGLARLQGELRDLAREGGAAPSLSQYLEASGRDLSEVYASGVGGWTSLRRAAGLLEGSGAGEEAAVSRRFGNILHVDEPARLDLYRRLAREKHAMFAETDERDRRRLLMLGLRLFANRGRLEGQPSSLEELLSPLLGSAALRGELEQLCDVLAEQIGVSSRPVDVPADWALSVHRTYAREEVLAAVGRSTLAHQRFLMEGVHRLREDKAELFFVTLDKSEKRFSPTTSYEDYAVSDRLFHWQSQSTTSETSPTGRNYVQGGAAGWRFHLFARRTIHDQFTFLGPVRYRSHRGSRPMSIEWELDVPIPPALLEGYATLRAG